MNILFVSLGCDKNLVDSEEMLGALRQRGYSFTDDEEEAEVAIVNTCCFIMDAQKESIDQILALAERRTSGQLKALIVTGCMAQRYKNEILREIPEVDAVIGTTAENRIADTLEEILGNEGEAGTNGYLLVANENRRTGIASDRVVTTGGYYSYLKIAEGCDKRCTYCVIPSIRGRYRSAPMEELEEQAKSLAAKGVKELILVAQETTLYGTDLYGYKALPELLHRLAAIDGIEWIRLMYCYPEEITREIAEAMSEIPKVLHYIDMPVQHASDDILRRMGRKTNRQELTEKVNMLREVMPDICIRTTLITGFPGEREEDHRQLMEFVEEMKFDRLGVFTYSKEEGTPAEKMSPQVPARVKKKRQKELMLLQQRIAFEAAGKMEGRVLEAIVEGQLAGEPVYMARTYKDAPGIDGALFIETQRDLMSGDLVKVRVTGSEEYDLVGRLESD
ncbi:MAG TPA: 30S ribosomal protein S12 methylthiotransferase RimO [Lachnospiraceae bacterium]|nr:30S ribosomal protein S12 methylthiotransferase RimO [Lachnospiraceae bacterium]